jgi:hypothetical protein
MGDKDRSRAPTADTTPNSRSRRIRWATPFAIAVVVLLWASAASATPAGSKVSSGTASVTCNSVSTPTPSALLIPLPNPATNLTANGAINVTWMFAVVGYSAADLGMTVHFPSVFAKFPLAGGGNFSMYFGPQNATIGGSGWMVPAGASRNQTAPTGLQFDLTRNATLSTEELAVMATAPYGQLTIEVRWQYSDWNSQGAPLSSSTSVPISSSGWPSATPSIFFPAELVYKTWTSGSTGVIGQHFNVTLGGPYVAGQRFQLRLVDPSDGSDARIANHTAPGSATTYTTGIWLMHEGGYLSPGTYLVHVRDSCLAILYSLSVTVAYAPSVLVHFVIDPASCGPITFNGTAYANGTTARIAPSTTPYSYSTTSCKGYSDHSTTRLKGGVYIESASHQILVSSYGTVLVKYW